MRAVTLPDLSAVYFEGVDRIAQHEATERAWRADDLQELAERALRLGADRRERGELPNPWLGSRYSEQRAHSWLRSKAAGMWSCRTGLAFRDRTCGLGVFVPSSCHTRGCPRCERQRAARLLERFELPAFGCPPDCKYLPHLTSGKHLERMRAPKLLTLTMPNVHRGELAAAAEQLRRGFRRLRQRALFRGGTCRTRGWAAKHAEWLEDHGRTSCALEPPGSRVRCSRKGKQHRRCGRYRHEPVVGGVYAIETTFNERTDTWHVHMHVLLEGPYLPAAELRDTWRMVVLRGADACRRCGLDRSSCSCAYVIDIQPVHCRRCRLPATRCRCEGNEGLRGALREVLKYVGKPTDDPDAVAAEGRGAAIVSDADDRYPELVLSWYGARLASGFGAWASLPQRDEPLDRSELVFVSHPHDPFAGWYLPRVCPWCEREAEWSNEPLIRSRLEAVRWRRGPPSSSPRPPPLLWHEPPILS